MCVPAGEMKGVLWKQVIVSVHHNTSSSSSGAVCDVWCLMLYYKNIWPPARNRNLLKHAATEPYRDFTEKKSYLLKYMILYKKWYKNVLSVMGWTAARGLRHSRCSAEKHI